MAALRFRKHHRLKGLVVDAVRVSGRSALQRRWAQVVASPGK